MSTLLGPYERKNIFRYKLPFEKFDRITLVRTTFESNYLAKVLRKRKNKIKIGLNLETNRSLALQGGELTRRKNIYIYVYSFLPLSRNNRSRFETSYSRISIGDRDASRRQKANEREEGEKKGEKTRRNNFAASSFGDGTPFWYRIFEKHAVKRRGERRGQLNNWLIKAAARFTDLLEMRFREKRHLARKRREQITRTRTAGENRISSSQLVRGAINRSVGPDSSYPQAQCG